MRGNADGEKASFPRLTQLAKTHWDFDLVSGGTFDPCSKQIKGTMKEARDRTRWVVRLHNGESSSMSRV